MKLAVFNFDFTSSIWINPTLPYMVMGLDVFLNSRNFYYSLIYYNRRYC